MHIHANTKHISWNINPVCKWWCAGFLQKVEFGIYFRAIMHIDLYMNSKRKAESIISTACYALRAGKTSVLEAPAVLDVFICTPSMPY